MKLSEILTKVNTAIHQDFDWSEVDEAMLELHRMLTEPKWAIEDEALRDECEKLLVSYAVQRYLNPAQTQGDK